MRLVFVLACVTVVTTAAAHACPRSVRCVVQQDVAAGSREAPRKKATATVPDVRRVQHVAPRAHLTFDQPRKPVAGEVEMPWIWQAVRERFDKTMPRYDQDKRFTVMLSPVVVTTPSDTIPGLGIAGDF